MRGREGPGQSVLAGPDGLRADGHPSARAAGQQRGWVPQRWLDPGTARRGPDRGELPAGTGVGRGEELLAYHAVADLRAHRHDGVTRGDDAADGLEDATLLLPGVGRQGDRGQRQLRRARVLARTLALAVALVRRERAHFRATAREQRER